MTFYIIHRVQDHGEHVGPAFPIRGNTYTRFNARCFWHALTYPWPTYFGDHPSVELENFHWIADDIRNNDTTRIYKWNSTYLRVKRFEGRADI